MIVASPGTLRARLSCMARSTRIAGILAHPTSLPTTYGVGDIGPVSHHFIDWLADAGMGLWQVLPLGPTGYGNSPYGASSAFAGNPLLISPEALVTDGLLPQEILADVPPFDPGRVDFDVVKPWKDRLLRQSYETFASTRPPEIQTAYDRFRDDEFHSRWLEDWALYSALKKKHQGEWVKWDEGLRTLDESTLDAAWVELQDEINVAMFEQFLFFRQWQKLRAHAKARKITLVGDMPIYVAYDSVDVWMNQELFQLDDSGHSTHVAGVPPDYFSETGQRWGNPLYRWDRIKEEGFEWWIDRIRANLLLTDVIRLDHFRAFAGYWSVPAKETTAVKGEWITGPGIELFDRLKEALGELPLIAEDLGLITPDVRELRERAGLPGMRVLQFAFSEDDNEHLPHRHERNLVVYTGTHDNDTSVGWFEAAPEHEKERARLYLGDDAPIVWQLIRAAVTSVADTAIIPLQDVLGLGSEARMNTPGKPEHNWSWRATEEQFANAPREKLRRLAEAAGRTRR